MLMVLSYMMGVVIGGVFFVSWWEVVFLYFLGVFGFVFYSYGWGGMYWAFSFGLGLDLLGWGLVVLTFWVGAVVFMVGVRAGDVAYSFMVSILVYFLSVSFLTTSYIWFYLFFESSLIPIVLLVFGWGYQPERLEAGYYLMFYTLFGSLPLLLSYLFVWFSHSSFMYGVIWWYGGSFWFLFSILAFLVKMPMFLTHLWLPRAHVEAPVGGSMFLAGVLLKLGGYGIFRIYYFFTSLACCGLSVITISVVGAVIVSFLCLRQYDIKSLVAYSSVAHMGLVLGGIFSGGSWGWGGAMVLMLGHGLCSSGLFFLSGVVYDRMGSRSIYLGRGLALVLPGLSLWWILLSAGNMAAPPTINLMGEVMLLVALYGWCSYVLFILVIVSFFGAAYTLYLYAISQHGGFNYFFGFSGDSVREHASLFFHWAPVNFLVLSGDMFYSWF
uniref:NADH-ubiquinone oxidoreductase chain 4 n=1 Tax=Strigamia maritima TaxID=126957 RepID=A0A0C5AR20_STRMM|nr:NADH dehydrogenase subunit 4 [Strigamia maritima]AJK90878.1 NADH dehydrogenase subunit 4 [Strigamia maritima]